MTFDTFLKEDGSINGMLDLRGAEPGQARRNTNPIAATVSPLPVAPRRLAPWLMLATLLGLLALHATPALADTVVSATATVTSPDGLNLRSGPATSYGVLAVIPGGATITITGSATSDNWLPVSYNGQIGWADGAYLSVTPGTPTPPAQPVAAIATVLPSDGLNLRSGPGATFSVATVLPGGSKLTVTGAPQGSWVPVSLNGSSGWVDASYISNDGTSPMIVANASSSTTGATVSVAAGSAPSSGSGSNAAHDTAGASSGSSAAFSPVWPNASRKITTIFSPAHLGIDIDQFPNGSKFPIGAVAPGTVTFAGPDQTAGYGNYVIIDHGNGFQTLYAHFSVVTVSKGQAVATGQQLGLSGCTGNCTGDHIHFEVHLNGKPVDPLNYLPPPWTIE